MNTLLVLLLLFIACGLCMVPQTPYRTEERTEMLPGGLLLLIIGLILVGAGIANA